MLYKIFIKQKKKKIYINKNILLYTNKYFNKKIKNINLYIYLFLNL
jgi:hypothetical protein